MLRGVDGCHTSAKPQPTTSADEALAGAQLPFGGHKGAAIAMMVELLAAGAAAATVQLYCQSCKLLHEVI